MKLLPHSLHPAFTKKEKNPSLTSPLPLNSVFFSHHNTIKIEQHIYYSTQNKNGKLLKADWGFFLKPFRKIFQEVFVYQISQHKLKELHGNFLGTILCESIKVNYSFLIHFNAWLYWNIYVLHNSVNNFFQGYIEFIKNRETERCLFKNMGVKMYD